MLILTRKAGEGIMIGPDIVIRVVEVKGGQVKLGVDAPGEVRVDREEVHERIGGDGDNRRNDGNEKP